MNKILLITLLIITGCKTSEDFDQVVKEISNFEIIASLEPHIGNFLEFDEEGNFYLTNKSTKEIYKYSRDGELLLKTGGIGLGPNEYEKGKGLFIDVGRNNIIAYNIRGYVINKYNTDLKLIDSYSSEELIFYAILIDDNTILTTHMDDNARQSVVVRDSKFDILYDGFEMMHHSSRFYEMLYSVAVLDKDHVIIGYLAVNDVRAFSKEGDMIKRMEIPGFPNEAPLMGNSFKKAPSYVLFKDIEADSIDKNIIILEGNSEEFNTENRTMNYSGTNRVHFLSAEGTYHYTVELPIDIEQITYFDNHLYGLQVDTLSTNIIKFKIEE